MLRFPKQSDPVLGSYWNDLWASLCSKSGQKLSKIYTFHFVTKEGWVFRFFFFFFNKLYSSAKQVKLIFSFCLCYSFMNSYRVACLRLNGQSENGSLRHSRFVRELLEKQSRQKGGTNCMNFTLSMQDLTDTYDFDRLLLLFFFITHC